MPVNHPAKHPEVRCVEGAEPRVAMLENEFTGNDGGRESTDPLFVAEVEPTGKHSGFVPENNGPGDAQTHGPDQNIPETGFHIVVAHGDEQVNCHIDGTVTYRHGSITLRPFEAPDLTYNSHFDKMSPYLEGRTDNSGRFVRDGAIDFAGPAELGRPNNDVPRRILLVIDRVHLMLPRFERYFKHVFAYCHVQHTTDGANYRTIGSRDRNTASDLTGGLNYAGNHVGVFATTDHVNDTTHPMFHHHASKQPSCLTCLGDAASGALQLQGQEQTYSRVACKVDGLSVANTSNCSEQVDDACAQTGDHIVIAFTFVNLAKISPTNPQPATRNR